MIPRKAVLLNPFALEVLFANDRGEIQRHGLCVVDCSWERAGEVFEHRARAQHRRLPLMLAGNPTNYAKLGKLSSAEAFAGALYITGFRKQADRILSKFSWGNTFLTLNRELLEDYSKSKAPGDIARIERDYFSARQTLSTE